MPYFHFSAGDILNLIKRYPIVADQLVMIHAKAISRVCEIALRLRNRG